MWASSSSREIASARTSFSLRLLKARTAVSFLGDEAGDAGRGRLTVILRPASPARRELPVPQASSVVLHGRSLPGGPGRDREAHLDVCARRDPDLLRLGHLFPVLLPARLDVIGVPPPRGERGRVELADRAGGGRQRALEP